MSDESLERPALAGKLIWMVVAVLGVALAGFVFVAHERSETRRLAAQNEQMQTALQQTSAQMDALNARLNQMNAEKEKMAQAAAHPAAPRAKGHRARRADDPRWKQVQTQLKQHQDEIDSTRQDLASARTELQGSIAKTHGELVLLQKKGERNYYEFDLDKSRQYRPEGPVGIRLGKANTRHQYADLELLVDDVHLTKKHVNLYEPVMFYPGDTGQPLELVINSISKNHIHGYVSAPKYRASELAAMSGGNGAQAAPAASSNGAPQLRQRGQK